MTTIGTTWRKAMDTAPDFAGSLGYDYTGPEHLLLAVLETRTRAINCFRRKYRLTGEKICTTLAYRTGRRTSRPGFIRQRTRPLENVLDKARDEAEALGHTTLCAEHLLLALLQIPEDETTVVREILERHGVDVDEALTYVREEVGRGISSMRERVYAATDFVD